MESRLGRPGGFARRDSPPSRSGNNNAESSRTPSPKQQHFSTSDAFERPGTRVAPSANHSWRPEHLRGRHDSPPFDTQRKPPTSETVAHQRVSPSTKQLKAAAVPPLSLSPVYAAANDAVQPPRTPQGRASYATFSKERGLTAAQRVRMELSAHGGSRAASGSRSNSSEDVFAARSPVYDEKKNGPRSCPSAFNGEEANPTRFSPHRRRQPRNGELIVSKLLPTRDSVNSLLTYLHELQISEASLRKQLLKTKQHTEEELYQSLSKLTELQRTMHEVERDRRIAQQRLEEKEQRIRELAAKLEKAEATKARGSPIRSDSSALEGPSHIAEEVTSYRETQPRTMTPHPRSPQLELKTPAPLAGKVPAPMEQPPASPLHPQSQLAVDDESSQFGILSPPSPHRPLWDPWASGGATPMKNLPPVFTIGSTGLDPMMNFPSPPEVLATSNSKIASDYELRSVLLSPRRVQDQDQAPNSVIPAHQTKQSPSTTNGFGQQEADPVEPLEQAPPFDVDATLLSPPYSQQQDRTPPNTPDAASDAPPHEQMPLLELPAPADPLLQIGAMPPIHESPYEHQSPSGTPTGRYAGCVGKVEWSSHGRKEMKVSAVSTPRLQMPIKAPTPSIQDNSETAERGPNQGVVDHTAAGEHDAVSEPLFNASPPAPTTQSPRPVLPVNDTKLVSSEPVSLETLFVDFFTEVDKKRLKMAKVYGKRYAGREKFLFTELTKRYGAAKVAELKARFENGSSSGESGSNNSTSSQTIKGATNGETSTKSSEAPAPQKPGRLGHPRHPQFFHPPTPASNVDLSGNMPPVPPPVVPVQENEALGSQVPETANGVVMPPSPSGKTSPGRGARVSPRQRRSGGSIPPFPGPPPPSFPTAQESNEGSESAGAAVDGPPMNGPPMMNGPPPPAQREAPAGQFNHPPPPPFAGMDSNAAPTGLRQRHNASAPAAQSQSNNATEVPAVTLEGLLKDLYKKHQPDKLKNVAIVAKQYAGKERELVGLLKGKYGALSVKHLEENLEVLERAHRARMGSKGAGKKRGCFVRTISLVFWLSVLLYFSFGAVFISFVVVDVWECHALDNDEQEPESADDCTPLQKELETFTYERVGDYVGQSHPEACFCLEWKARESALLSNLSGVDLVNLARMVPFSPDSFGAPWVASVKEQVPSQEFYDSYAKPVVDVSLDVGSFVWSSLLELAGFDEVAEKSSVVSDVVETMNDTDEVALLDEENELDTLMDSYEAGYEEVKDEGFVAEKESLGEPSDEAEVEAAVVADVSGQMPMEEGNDQIQDELQTQELQTQEPESIVTEILPVLVDEDDAVPVDEEAVLASEENTSIEPKEVMVEERAAVDSSPVGELESEVDVLMEETETSSDAGGNDSADLVDDVVTEVVSEEDGRVSNSVEEVKSEAADNDVSSASNDDVEVDASVETDEVGVAEESFEPATVDNDDGDSGIVCEESSAESEDVVEVEVLQEGLDLSYPETSVEQPDEANVEFNELPSTNLNEENEEIQAALGDNEEVSAASDEGETKVTGSDIEYGSVSVDELEVEADMVTDVTDDDEPEVEADVGMTESEAEVPSEASEVEVGIVDEESANPDDLETGEDASYGLTPSEDVEPDTAVLDGESSSTIDLETLVALKSESKAEVDKDAIVAGEISVGEDDDNHVDVDTTAPAKEEETMPVEDDVDSDTHDVEAVANTGDDELAALAGSETKTVGLPWEEEVGSPLGKDVGEELVDTPELYEDDREETVAASVKLVTTEQEAAENGWSSEAENENSEDVANVAEVVEVDAEPTHPIDVEAEQSVSEHGLVEESVTIEATGASDEVAASTESVGEADSHEIVDTFDKSAVSIDATDTAEVADDRGSFEAEIMVQAVKRTESNDDNVEEDNEDEEIAFMEELADPDEVLRLAEQAAAAELSFETR